MRTIFAILSAFLLLTEGVGVSVASAACQVHTSDATYGDGEYLSTDECDEVGAQKVSKGVGVTQLLSSATATGSGTTYALRCTNRTFQAMGTTSAGAGSATIVIEGSNKTTPVDGTTVDWTTLGTITLTLGTTQTNDGFVSSAAWKWIRARVSSISGTGGTVNAYAGCGL